MATRKKQPSESTQSTTAAAKRKSAKRSTTESPVHRERQDAACKETEPEALNLTDEAIALQAYLLWESRGKPLGSPEEDWHNAKSVLKSTYPSLRD